MKTKKCLKQQKTIRKNCNPNKEKDPGIHGLFGAKGHISVDNGKKDPYKNKEFYNFLSRMKIFKINLQSNVLFWITYTISIITLSISFGKQSSIVKNIFMGYFSVILVMSTGYMAHYIAHILDFKQLYIDFIYSNYFFGEKFRLFSEKTHKKIQKCIVYTLDFHDTIHHDSSINKSGVNIFIEAVQNLLLEGGLWIIASIIFGLGIECCGEIYRLNMMIMLLWILVYTSVHLINYRIVHPNSHIAHHMDYYTNLSLTDFFDLVFDTSHDKNNIQDINHFTINVLVITFLLYVSKNVLE
jgi:hypothetical protein